MDSTKFLKTKIRKGVVKRGKMKVLMCTNGKKTAEDAIEFGCSLFRKPKVDAVVLYVQPKDGPDGTQYLKKAEKILSKHGIKAKTKAIGGEPSAIIAKEAKKHDLVVTGYKDVPKELKGLKDIFTSRFMDDVTENIETSMLVVKSPRPVRKVLACTDGSKSAEKAIMFFGSLNESGLKVSVDVVNVIPEVYHRFKDILEPIAEKHLNVISKLPGERTKHLYRAKDILAKYSINASIILKEGDAAEEIASLAEKGYDLIVMGTRGLKAEQKKTMGRQARKVIRNSPVSVLAIK